MLTAGERATIAFAIEWLTYYSILARRQGVTGPMKEAMIAESYRDVPTDEPCHADSVSARIIAVGGTPVTEPKNGTRSPGLWL